MEEVKRYDLTAPEKGMPMLYPSDKGVCVLYTDYAALKARVEELERGKDAMLWADLTVKLREATQERDSLRVEVMEQARLLGMSGSREADLRAQLEAAKADCGFWKGKAEYYASQLTAQPEGVRGLARRLIRACRQHDIGGVGTVEEYLNAQHALAIELAKTESLAAPASPAPEGVWIPDDGPGSFNGARFVTPAPAPLDKSEGPSTELVYKAAPAPDDCMACIGEKWGMPPGGSELHTCPKAAPAPVCQTCGDEKYVFHELDLSKPCPDCAKEGK